MCQLLVFAGGGGTCEEGRIQLDERGSIVRGGKRWREAEKRWKGPDRESAKGNREVQSKRDISLSKSVCSLLASLLPVSVPSVANYR